LFERRSEHAVDTSGGAFLQAWQDVAVRVARDPDRGVAGTLARDLGMQPVEQQMAYLSVPQIVKLDKIYNFSAS